MNVVHLHRDGTSVLLDATGTELPRILHIGEELALPDDDVLRHLPVMLCPPVVSDSLDDPPRRSVMPEPVRGWLGTPGLSGDLGGAHALTHMVVDDITASQDRAEVSAHDDQLGLGWEIRIVHGGLAQIRARVTNLSDAVYGLATLDLSVPVGDEATELLTLEGRHIRERHPQRSPFIVGHTEFDNRRGRTSLQSTTLVMAGEPGFDFDRGRVWEVRLTPGESYTSPWLFVSHGTGIDEASARFHTWLRDAPGRVTRPRPVTLNTWEAVYYHQNLDDLAELARLAGRIGVERFVLDDGWFGGRCDDSSGLGDWTVSEEIWPDGLGPLIDAVRRQGMEFGLRVEPEMVNPGSGLARAHPAWILGDAGHAPRTAPAGRTPRWRPSTASSTGSRPTIPAWRSSPAPAAAGGSTWRCSPAPTGSG